MTTTLHCFNLPFKTIQNNLNFYSNQGITHLLISPPNLTLPGSEWWGRYQPIHYFIIAGPLGNKDELISLCSEANKYNISIVADLVLNHMSSKSNNSNSLNFPLLKTLQNHKLWSEIKKQYDTLPVHLQKTFPMSGSNNYLFTADDFHPEKNIEDYTNRKQVLYNQLGNLLDLNQDSMNVYTMQTMYIDFLVSLGITSVRFDAIKHMPAGYLANLVLQFQQSLIKYKKCIPDNSYALLEHIPNNVNDIFIYLNAVKGLPYTDVDGTELKYVVPKDAIKVKVLFYDFPLMSKISSYVLPQVVWKNGSKDFVYNENIADIINPPKDSFVPYDNSMAFITNHDIIHNDCFGGWLMRDKLEKRMAYVIMFFGRKYNNVFIHSDNYVNAYTNELLDEKNNNAELVKILQLRKSLSVSNFWTLANMNNILYIGQVSESCFFVINNNEKFSYDISSSWPNWKYLPAISAGKYKDIFDGVEINVLNGVLKEKLTIPPNTTLLFVKQ